MHITRHADNASQQTLN